MIDLFDCVAFLWWSYGCVYYSNSS